MRLLLCALLFAAACKTREKSSSSDKPTPTERGTTTSPHAPALPGAGSDGPDVVNREQPRDFNDPAFREELEQRREERRKRMDAQLDTNHDGVVSPEERQVRVKPMYDRLDANGDGKLTPEELAASDRRMGFDDPAAIDADKNGEITLGELDAAMEARRAQMREKWRGNGGRGNWSGGRGGDTAGSAE